MKGFVERNRVRIVFDLFNHGCSNFNCTDLFDYPNLGALKELVNNGADVSTSSEYPVLHLAAVCSNYKVFKFILSRQNANVLNSFDRLSKTPMYYAVRKMIYLLAEGLPVESDLVNKVAKKDNQRVLI